MTAYRKLHLHVTVCAPGVSALLSAAVLLTDMQVSLKCGSAEKLMKVEKPSRCEYIATLATPAACTLTEAQAVQDQLAALSQELKATIAATVAKSLAAPDPLL